MHNPTQVQAWGGGRVFRSLGYVTQFSKPASFGSNTFLTFASVLIRSEVFTQIGLLDEQYFMYFDDSDYCFRARNAGWKLAIAADTAVLHKEGGTVGREKSLLKERIVTTSGLYFLRRHTAVPPLTMTLFAISRFLKRLLRGDLGGVRAVARGVSDWWHARPAALEQGS
jgi:GT2 family glycosyltransferase